MHNLKVFRGRAVRACRIALLGAAAWVITGCSSTAASTRASAGWDAQAAMEAEQTMHEFHKAWDTMDLGMVEEALSDDGFLTTFEYTDDKEAVRLSSKAEVVNFLKQSFDRYKKVGASTVAIPQRKMECRATADLAVCTEECDIILTHTDGTREVAPHRGTSVLRKFPEGWKFTHWHVSDAGPGRTLAANEPYTGDHAGGHGTHSGSHAP